MIPERLTGIFPGLQGRSSDAREDLVDRLLLVRRLSNVRRIDGLGVEVSEVAYVGAAVVADVVHTIGGVVATVHPGCGRR